jgi:hypothetical protein
VNDDWQPTPIDTLMEASVRLYPTASPAEVRRGTATTVVDLTDFTKSARHSVNEANVTVTWFHELDGANQPRVGQLLAIAIGTQPLWIGIVDAIQYTHRRGQQQLSITARSRDGTPLWRNIARQRHLPRRYAAHPHRAGRSCWLGLRA